MKIEIREKIITTIITTMLYFAVGTIGGVFSGIISFLWFYMEVLE